MSREPGPERSPDAAKLIYSARMLLVSAGLFGVAGAIWLVSGNGAGIGIGFLVVAALMATAARAIATRV